MYEIVVLKEGYSIKEGPGMLKACGSITLLKGPRNVIVDTGNPWDKDLIMEALSHTGLEPGDIHYVVCTCSHSEKAGNLNVFDKAVCIMAGGVSHHGHHFRHGFNEDLFNWECIEDWKHLDETVHTWGADCGTDWGCRLWACGSLLKMIMPRCGNYPLLRAAMHSTIAHGTFLKVPNRKVCSKYNVLALGLDLKGLKKHDLTTDKIEFVVCTHGHSDHVGNLNLFPNAIHIVSHDICVGDTYMLHDFKKGIPYEIDDDIEVVSTPGHTGSDVSVIVRNTKQGTVAVTGDLFERLEDLEDFTLWQENSENPEAQQYNRLEVLKFADWIIPGHGPMFAVPNEYKQQLKMVMFYEQTTMQDGPSGSTTHSETSYTIIEED